MTATPRRRPPAALIACLACSVVAGPARADASAATPAPAGGSLAAIVARGTLRVGMFAGLEPFVTAGDDALELERRTGAHVARAGNGRPIAGLDVDLAAEAARALGVRLEIVLVERFDELLPGLVAGRYDVVMSALTRTLGRAAVVSFSEPYFASGLEVRVRDPGRTPTLESLRRPAVRVAVRAGTTAEAFARSALAGATLVRLESDAALYAALDDRAIDAVVADSVNMRDAEVRQRAHAHLTWLDERRFGVEHFAFATRHGDRDWLDWLDLLLRELKASGRFLQIAARYNAWFRSPPW